MQLSVKKYKGASEVKINFFKKGTHPINIARICKTVKNRKLTEEMDNFCNKRSSALVDESKLTEAIIGGWRICLSFNFS